MPTSAGGDVAYKRSHLVRALVEENVKINVQRIAQDSSVQHVRRAPFWSCHRLAHLRSRLQAWYLYEQQSSAQSTAPPTTSSTPSTENNEPALLEPLQPLTSAFAVVLPFAPDLSLTVCA